MNTRSNAYLFSPNYVYTINNAYKKFQDDYGNWSSERDQFISQFVSDFENYGTEKIINEVYDLVKNCPDFTYSHRDFSMIIESFIDTDNNFDKIWMVIPNKYAELPYPDDPLVNNIGKTISTLESHVTTKKAPVPSHPFISKFIYDQLNDDSFTLGYKKRVEAPRNTPNVKIPEAVLLLLTRIMGYVENEACKYEDDHPGVYMHAFFTSALKGMVSGYNALPSIQTLKNWNGNGDTLFINSINSKSLHFSQSQYDIQYNPQSWIITLSTLLWCIFNLSSLKTIYSSLYSFYIN